MRADKAADINRLRRRLEKSEAVSHMRWRQLRHLFNTVVCCISYIQTYALDKQRAESELRSIEQEIEQIQSEIEVTKKKLFSI